MISPELLRQYPFFALLEDSQLKALAMISTEITFEEQSKVFNKGEQAERFYFLLDGSVGLYYTADEDGFSLDRGIPVGEINPGEPFGISALIKPHVLTSTAWASASSRALEIDASALRALFELDERLAYALTFKAARAAMERLLSTRIQLAAAWA
jgi:CRP-like cAMP-binding protein